LRQHDLVRECETNALSIEIRFIHIPVEAGMAAVSINVQDWCGRRALLPVMGQQESCASIGVLARMQNAGETRGWLKEDGERMLR
jgi:hypothetical protein